jgi:Ca-activated chloride channel family protein
MLSDYSFLRQDDKKEKRVEEVTQLGLKYNLLTAYTSFVAIDSLVRNKEGDSTTVNQPLPLPQGVSDYAVGMPAYAPAAHPGVRYKASKPMADARGGGRYYPEESAYQAPPEPATVKSGVKALIEKVEASDPASAGAIRRTAESKITELRACNGGNLQGRLVVRLVIGADGKVKSAVATADGIKNAKLKKCVAEAMKKWQFDASSNADITARITLVF